MDLGRIPGLNYIREDGGAVHIGAMATHHEVEISPLMRGKCPLLAETAAHIGDVQVRNMGTIGGSVAHADPAADYPAALLALEAQDAAASARKRERTVAATSSSSIRSPRRSSRARSWCGGDRAGGGAEHGLPLPEGGAAGVGIRGGGGGGARARRAAARSRWRASASPGLASHGIPRARTRRSCWKAGGADVADGGGGGGRRRGRQLRSVRFGRLPARTWRGSTRRARSRRRSSRAS